MKPKNFLFLSPLVLMSLVSCGGGTSSTPGSQPASGEQSTPVSSEAPAEEEISVFVLAGQSNMEGQTQWKDSSGSNLYLQNAMRELESDENYDVKVDDYDKLVEGMPEVMTTFYGYPYGEPYDLHASVARGDLSDDDYLLEGLKGNFVPTRAGMGFKRKSEANERWMGPELGCAYVLSKHATAEKPVYFVKCAFSGGGFEKNAPDPTWKVQAVGDQYSFYTDKLKPLLNNSLEKIKEAQAGKKVVIKGFIWHQGESDSGGNVDKYYDNMTTLLNTFRSDYAAYGPEAKGENIAFLDCTIFDGSGMKGGMTWSRADDLSNVKRQIEALSDKNFLINGSVVEEGGLGFKISGDGGDGMAHYCTKDSFRLGMEYGKIIVNNHLI